MHRCGVVVAILLLTGCTSTVRGHSTPPAGPTLPSPTPAASGSALPHSPCEVLGDAPDLITLLGGQATSEQEDYCRIDATHGSSAVMLHHNRFVSLEAVRAGSAGTPRAATVGHRPAFFIQDPDRVRVTVGRFPDPARPGVLECTVLLDNQDNVSELALAIELLTRVLPRYEG